MYGFYRMKSPGKKGFFHEKFVKGREDLLKFVKRKMEKKRNRGDNHNNKWTISDKESE